MAGESTNLVFDYLRRIDVKLDRVIEDMSDLKVPVTGLEQKFARTEIAIGNLELSIAGVNRRIDRVDVRLDRIERRLDLVELPH
jgi:hypothetical protein